jgi:FkbM family methyltransferase
MFLKISPINQLGSLKVRFLPDHYQYNINSWRNVNRDGIKYNLNIHNIVDWFIYFNIQETSRKRLNSLINKSNVFYDIGANIGHVSLVASNLINENGIIYSFEPHPVSFKQFKNHIELNDISNIFAFNVGLGSSSSFVNMLEVEGNAGANRIVASNVKNSNFTLINIVSLDEFILNKNAEVPDLIKVDVEGYELEVFKGAENLLNDIKPKLFFELDERLLKLQNTSPIELLMFLSKFDYKFFNADDYKSIDLTYDFSNCHFDIIAIADF